MLDKYTDVITTNELNKILHISKNNLCYLLSNNIITNKHIYPNSRIEFNKTKEV